MIEGMNVNERVHNKVLENTVSQQAVTITLLQAIAQQLLEEIEELKKQVPTDDRITELKDELMGVSDADAG